MPESLFLIPLPHLRNRIKAPAKYPGLIPQVNENPPTRQPHPGGNRSLTVSAGSAKALHSRRMPLALFLSEKSILETKSWANLRGQAGVSDFLSTIAPCGDIPSTAPETDANRKAARCLATARRLWLVFIIFGCELLIPLPHLRNRIKAPAKYPVLIPQVNENPPTRQPHPGGNRNLTVSAGSAKALHSRRMLMALFLSEKSILETKSWA